MILARGSFLTHSLSIMPQLRAMSGFSYLGGGRGRGRESEGERGEGRRERRREGKRKQKWRRASVWQVVSHEQV